MSRWVTAVCILSIATMASIVFGGAARVAVASTAKTVASELVLDNNGTAVETLSAPCTTKAGCDNGLRLLWAKGPCYDQRTYAPIAVGWFYNGIPSPKYWPIASPCGTGITLGWNTKGTLGYPTWVKAPIKNQDLARFPTHANQATVYAYGGHDPTTAEWLMNGKIMSTITLPTADDATWTSYLSSSSAVHKHTTPALPTVTLWGRVGTFTDKTAKATAPTNSNGIQLAWFLALSQKGQGRVRGCRLINGTYWTDPPVMFEYLNHGNLEGRLNLLTCPTPGGSPLDFNMINFGWSPSGSEYNLTSATPSLNNSLMDPSGWLPQPPAGTDGLYFESDLDDFQWAYWLNGNSYDGKAISHPAHVRFQTWSGAGS